MQKTKKSIYICLGLSFVIGFVGVLIVSCQARKGWAMYGSQIMAAFAAAALEGGAGGIRANGAADIIALDAKDRSRPNGETFASIVERIRRNFPEVLIMGEIATLKEAAARKDREIDLISTTLSGYTPDSADIKEVNLSLIAEITKNTRIPVIAEGRIQSAEEAVEAFRAGAHAVVVGTSITRPEIITSQYTDAIDDYWNCKV